jgi:1-acyl-sn-glycerol-3-phosphate acyltransferase
VLSAGSRFWLRVQGLVSQVFVLLTYYSIEAWMRFRRYRILDHGRVRAEFAALAGNRRRPLLVCANHLTLIDSLIIQWALAPGWRLFVRPGWFLWNLPDKYNMSINLFVRLLGYFGKCVLVRRKGPPEEIRLALDQVAYLLGRGQSVLIFPEGGRSRIGRVDTENFMYGVGRMIQESGGRVVCVRARRRPAGLQQHPKTGEAFVVGGPSCRRRRSRMRADRDLAAQIVPPGTWAGTR